MSDSRFDPRRPEGRLGDRLGALRADTDRCALPSARSIRRSGDRRNAIQVAGTTLAAASAIGLGAFVLPVGGGEDVGPSGPTHTPTEVPTLTEDVLLGIADLTAVDQFADWDLSWQQTRDLEPLAGPGVCAGPAALPPSIQSVGRSFRTSGDPATLPVGVPYDAASSVTVFGDVATAESALEIVRDRLLACGDGTPASSRASALWVLGGAGDVGFAVEVLTPESDRTLGGFHQVALARSGPVIIGVWLNLNAPDAPVLTPTLDLLEIAVDRVCEVTGTACAAEPVTAERAALETPGGGSEQPSTGPTGDGDPLLAIAELPTWNGVLPWDTAFDVEDVEAGPYGVVCHPWRDLGATAETQRVYSVVTGADPGEEPSASEVVADFPDEAAAVAAMDAVRTAMAGCEGNGQVDPSLTVAELGAATADGTAWLVTLPSSGADPQRVLLGVVRSGSKTAMITVSHASPDPLPPEPFLDLLDRAVERLSQ